MRWALSLLLAAQLVACGRVSDALSKSGERAEDPACPARARAGATLPDTTPELEKLDYWLREDGAAGAKAREIELDRVLASADDLADQDESLRSAPDGSARIVDLGHAPSSDELKAALRERIATYQESFRARQYESARAEAERELAKAAEGFVEQRELHVALAPIDLRCVPFAEPIYSVLPPSAAGAQAPRVSERFDRNACSRARAQEPIELLGTIGGMRLARSSNAFGFVGADAPLSPLVPPELEARYRAGAAFELTTTLELAGQQLPAGTLLRLSARETSPGDARERNDNTAARTAWIATREGFVRSRALAPSEALSTRRALTRRAFLTEAFRYVGTPYGWGDEDGGRDCSRFVLDVLASFGVGLPRTSAHQSRSGRYVVDVPKETSETERLALLDEAHERGLVLVHFPGHIMFYLGRDRAGVPRVLHSLAEYVAPCPGGGETLFEVGRVSVTDLSLGRGTSRTSFLERMTALTVFGAPPGYELLALSRFRAPVAPRELAPKRCQNGNEVALFSSPHALREGQPLRVIAVSQEDIRPASLWLVSPAGELVAPQVNDLGVGPYARWVEQTAPSPGKWRALVADGAHVLACQELRVAPASAPAKPHPRAAGPAWSANLRWERPTEALYAAFVEQLFSHPVEDLKSWSSLSELLQKPERNLLFDHRGFDEDRALTLAPDCADLPYLLRAYFAWKMGLPFAFRHCTRGRAGVPPRCDAPVTNELPVSSTSELAAFEAFWRELTNGVHSASGRTLPGDSATDLYPIALERRALPPGTVFADPYGHMIVVGKWLPQGLGGEGMLLGADAQPDATVGRRRFWRGNFLFTPDTHDVGAGFKAFRPIVQDRGARRLVPLDDDEIAKNRDFPAPSRAQYEGSLDDFYQRMDQLIYPRPVALLDRMRRVVDALEEQVKRRVEAVDVGEAAMRDHKDPISMPEGYAIFETSGPWEDFATPSRDMRLLVAIDAVRAFPAQVRAEPARYGVDAQAKELSEVDARLAEQLKSQRFGYTRTDGSSFELTLADVVARSAALETAYNPNDCVEARWGAVEGTPERATCKRVAPAEQTASMERYRSWFHKRERPPRPANKS